MPPDARSLASPHLPDSPTPTHASLAGPAPRHISARDVRDLALAVIEGAVAAEALAKELKRSPDRSRHFQDIAERLRAVVGRASIRNALAEESAAGNVVLTPMITQPTHAVSMPSAAVPPASVVAPPPLPPKIAPAIIREAPTPAAGQPIATEELRASGERVVPPLTTDELVAIVTRAIHGDEISTRLARLEHAVTAASQTAVESTKGAVAEATAQVTLAANAGERFTISTPADALSLATRLTERVQSGVTVTVRLEPSTTAIRRG